ncbi:MAG: SPOR domain-containing protein [Thermodesulfobacteriota bacterium]
MQRFPIIPVLAAIIIGCLPFSTGFNYLQAEETTRFMLQTAAFPTLDAAQKELDRLKTLGIQARYTTKEDQTKKKWYAVYINQYPTREEAARQGNQLIQKGAIQNFFIFPMKGLIEESSPTREKALELQPQGKPSQKESKPPSGKNPIFFGPIVIKEEDSTILMTIGLDRRIFPQISAQKNDLNSKLFITFNHIDKVLVPVDFRKDQNQALMSFSVAQKGSDCTFILVLNPAYNYEVSQNYFEKEKLYSLRIRWEAAGKAVPSKEKET